VNNPLTLTPANVCTRFMLRILTLIAHVHVNLFCPAVWRKRFSIWRTELYIQQLKFTLFLVRLFKN